MNASRIRISKRVVDALKPRETAWDTEVRGFGVRRQAAARVYVLKASIAGRQRWITIGEHGAPWTPDTARKEAQRLWGCIRSGLDPRPQEIQKPLMADLCERYLREHAKPFKKPRSVATDASNIRNHIVPLLGKLAVADVGHDTLQRFMRQVNDGATALPGASRQTSVKGAPVVTGGPGIANRCLLLLSKMLNLAERWGWRVPGSNPVRHVPRFREKGRERYLSPTEMARLGSALSDLAIGGKESPYALAAIKLLLFTGARVGEVLALKWEWVDLERGIAHLPDSKTGQKPIFLSGPTVSLLRSIPRNMNNPHVICGALAGKPLVNLQKPWLRICEAASISNVRLHDLRHSFASAAAASGLSLPLIGKLLGHSRPETTARYAHLGDDPLRVANETVGESLAHWLGVNAPLA